VLRTSRAVESEQILSSGGRPKRDKLRAELLQQKSEIFLIGSCRELPIDVEPIKQAGGSDGAIPIAADVANDKHVDAGGGERLASCLAAGGERKCDGVGAGCATYRNQSFQIGMKLLELENLREVAIERPAIGDASDRH